MNAGTLRAALADVLPSVHQRSPRPVLTNVRLGDGLLTGTDLELRIDREIDYVGEPVLLPAHRLSAILREVDKNLAVRIEPKGTTCKISAGRGEWTLPTESPSEFPPSGIGSLSAVCRMPGDQFARAIQATAYAVDKESSRYALGAVLLEVKSGNPTFVATNGRRMAIVEAETDQAVDDRQVLMQQRAAMAMLAAFGKTKSKKSDDDEDTEEVPASGSLDPNKLSVQIETDGKWLVMSAGPLTVSGLIVEGRYPRWREVVPDRENAKATAIDRQLLKAAVRQAAIVTSEASKGLKFAFAKNGLHISGRSSEYGESSVTCEVEDAGDTGSVMLDPVYVREFLSNLNAGADPIVEVEIAGPGDAVIFRCDDATGLVMPLAND